MKSKWLITSFSCILVGSSAAIIEVIFTNYIDSILPEITQIKDFKQIGSITFLSTNQETIQKIGPSTRKKLEGGKIPENIEKAFISAEDRRFYSHKGVDFIGIIRAVITNLQEREFKEGASTINQQLARIVYLNQKKNSPKKN